MFQLLIQDMLNNFGPVKPLSRGRNVIAEHKKCAYCRNCFAHYKSGLYFAATYCPIKKAELNPCVVAKHIVDDFKVDSNADKNVVFGVATLANKTS